MGAEPRTHQFIRKPTSVTRRVHRSPAGLSVSSRVEQQSRCPASSGGKQGWRWLVSEHSARQTGTKGASLRRCPSGIFIRVLLSGVLEEASIQELILSGPSLSILGHLVE